MASMQERAPEDTLLVYHTLHVPRRTSDPGMWESDAFLAQHVAQLNAAGRQVAQSLQYHIVDVEAMAAQMSQESVLIDNTHPGPDFMMQVISRAPSRPAGISDRTVRWLILQHPSGYALVRVCDHIWGAATLPCCCSIERPHAPSVSLRKPKHSPVPWE